MGICISGFSSWQDQSAPAANAVINSDLMLVCNDFLIAGANLQFLRETPYHILLNVCP